MVGCFVNLCNEIIEYEAEFIFFIIFLSGQNAIIIGNNFLVGLDIYW